MKEHIGRCMMKKILLMMFSIVCFSFLGNVAVFAEETTVMPSDYDTKVIPDLYNTGVEEPEGGLTVVTDSKLPCTINGEPEVLDGASTNNRFVLNLKYKHRNLNGKIVIENADLSEYTFAVYNPETLKEEGRNISFVFNNCKLKSFAGGRSSVEGISYEFNHCSFFSAYGSDVTFNRCRFGGGIGDRLNLFVNCFVNDCYIYNPTSDLVSEGEIHVDGIQIYGNNTNSTVKTENIHFDNCRFEMPSLRYANAPKAYVNACIMLQTEFSDGDNMSFENCYVNGGGFSIYAHGAKGTKISNITFKNLKFGCTAIYGKLYPDKPEQDQVEWNEDTWDNASSVYVGTVKRDSAKKETYLCVSNDTNEKRYFRAYTSNGKYYDYSIDACPTYKEFNGKGFVFEDFPFDQVYTIPEYCDWVVVYEMLPTQNSTLATMNQVRFQNWTEEKSVTIPDASAATLEYELSEDGTLTISGFGQMPEFSSTENVPWYLEREKIKKVVIKGVTSVSKSAFSDCVNLEEIVVDEAFQEIDDFAFSGCTKLSKMNLNQSKELKSIGESAFLNCVSLDKVSLPESIVSIGSDAFSVDTDTVSEMRKQTDVYYEGSVNKWLTISFANLKSNPMYLTGGNLYVNGDDLLSEFHTQECSVTSIKSYAFAGCLSLKTVDLTGVTEIGTYSFVKSNVSGKLVIPETVKKFGTYAFSECSSMDELVWKTSMNVPMGAFQNTGLKEIVISGSLTGVSNWAFKGCVNLAKVTLPDTIKTFAQQSFQNCKSLKEINIPDGVTGLGNFTFSGCTSLEKISLPDSVASFGISVFASCTNLKEIHLSSELTDLGNSCFNRCESLETIELPKSLTSISSSAFNECSSLKTIQIPASVTEIKSRAFYKCKSLQGLFFMGTECPTITSDAFNYIPDASVLIYIPENATGYKDNATLMKIAQHLYGTKVVEAASCIAPGKEQYTCLIHENCESNYEKVTQTVEHQPGVSVSENVVPATYESEGSYEEVCYCSVCKKELSREKKTIDKLVKEDTTEQPTTEEPTTEEPTTETTEKAPVATTEEPTTEEPTTETTEKAPVVTTEEPTTETTEKAPVATTEEPTTETTEKAPVATTEEPTTETTEKAPVVTTEASLIGRTQNPTIEPTENQPVITDEKVVVTGTALKKVVNKKKIKMQVLWKMRKGVSGYEIQYCTNRKFKKVVHTKKITGFKKGKATIKRLKKNKRYYVRIRTYKIVNGKKYVSKWSKKKSVKILK